MAQLAGQYWANVSAAPPSNAAALTEVLQAVQASGLQFSQQLADSLGSVDITADEVRVALKHSAPGKAPGLDGLPVDIYRKCSPLLAPLLARVYSAMGRLGELPTGFLDGLVVTLYRLVPALSLATTGPSPFSIPTTGSWLRSWPPGSGHRRSPILGRPR